MNKTFIINFNPNENPKRQYLEWGLLGNPFPIHADVPPSGPITKRSSLYLQTASEEHLRYGITLDQAKWLLKNLVSEEAVGYILKHYREGNRLEVMVDSDKMQIGIRELTLEEHKSLLK